MNTPHLIRSLAVRFPEVVPHLTGRARWLAVEAKTTDYFEHELERMIRNVYNGQEGGEFIGLVGSLVFGQLRQAFNQAWMEEGTDAAFPDYLATAHLEMYQEQWSHAEQLYRDIIDARVDGTPLEPLLSRATLWAQNYTAAYNEAVRLIVLNEGGNLQWIYGDTEHCDSCRQLNGIVARASEWDALGVKPQNAPNDYLTCGGWRCQCRLEPTDKRRSPKAVESILNAVSH